MNLYDLKINHIKTPIGFMLPETPVLSYKIKNSDGTVQSKARIVVSKDSDPLDSLYDSSEITEAAPVYPLPVNLEPRTRYRVALSVTSDAGEIAEAQTWFETGKAGEPWQGQWISPKEDADNEVCVLGTILSVPKEVKNARLYIGCAGLFMVELNGDKVGNEFLTPYSNDYSSWMQTITFDVSGQLCPGENLMEVTLAGGWYKGTFGLEHKKNIYGDKLALISELHIEYEDGSHEVKASDNRWYSRKSVYESAEIYNGVAVDFNRAGSKRGEVSVASISTDTLTDRLSLPVLIKEQLPVEKVFTTPKGEKCLDMGQNMVGWLRIDTSDFADSDFTLKFFEVLDPDGNFYNANLRAAKQELVYRSDGNARVWEPEFTFYGFRYVLVEGLEKVEADWFTGCVAYSDMEQTGEIKTSKELVNRLFLNALWSQKGNFVDVPTDCPQRDERLGWTGDAQIFCGAANFNMDVTAFFAKYMYDVYQEQQKSGGVVPFFVPSFGNNGDFSSAMWGDAATIIPWTCYLHSGDTYVLERQYPGMKAWVEYIRKQDRGSRLWNTGFHLGDWLALDNIKTEMRTGLTPTDMVASAYYLYSVTLLAKAAKVLRKHEEQQEYEHLADEIKQAMQNEYVTPTGRIASDTQTANVIALYMGFAIDQSRAAAMLHEKLMNNDGHLNTGFVGTAYLCRVLSDHGYNDTAYRLFLNRDYPGWLYAVERGATTIWERWNSILPDGSLGDAEMNSFNHYSYGAIMEWVYRNVGGLQPMDDGAGFRRVRLAPQPNNRLEWISVTYDSACGTYRSEWRIEKEQLRFIFEIPFGATALLTLPDAPVSITLNGQARAYSDGMKLRCGRYEISYRPTIEYYTEFGLCSNAKEVFQNPKLMAILNEYIPAFSQIPQHAFVFPFEGDVLSFLTQVGIVLTSDVQRDITDKMASIRTWDI